MRYRCCVRGCTNRVHSFQACSACAPSLSDFRDALRECLGLVPMRGDNRSGRCSRAAEEERFRTWPDVEASP